MRRSAVLLVLLPLLAACASDSGATDVTAGNAECPPAKTGLDYGYVVPSSLSTITAGQTIEFELENTGTVEHEFEVLGPDGKAVGEVGETEAGKTGKADITLTKSGTYTFRCGIEDHEKRGMKGTFVVP